MMLFSLRNPLLLGALSSGMLCAAPAGARRAPTPPPTPTVALLSPDARLVAAQSGRTIRIWRRSSGKQLVKLDNNAMFRGALAASTLVGVAGDGVRAWFGPGFKRSVKLKVPKVISLGRMSISANGRVATILYRKDGGVEDPDTVGVFDTRSGRKLAQLTLPARRAARVLGAALSPDGRTVAVFGDEHKGKAALLRIYRVGRGKPKLLHRWRDRAEGTCYSAAFAPDGRTLALGTERRLLLWDARKGRRIAARDTNAIKALFPRQLQSPRLRMPGPHLIAFRRDGKQLVTLHGFGVVGVARWKVDGLKPVGWIKRHRAGGTMRAIAWDRRGTVWLASSTYSPRVWLHAPRGDRFATVKVLGPEAKAAP